MLKLESLRQFRLIYLASPYLGYPSGTSYAAADVAAISARIMEHGINVYSPIVMTHFAFVYGNMDKKFDWLEHDAMMLDVADCLLVAKMRTWEESTGVRFEINHFLTSKKPVFYLNPDTLQVTQEEK